MNFFTFWLLKYSKLTTFLNFYINSPKLISRKIWLTWHTIDFHTVQLFVYNFRKCFVCYWIWWIHRWIDSSRQSQSLDWTQCGSFRHHHVDSDQSLRSQMGDSHANSPFGSFASWCHGFWNWKFHAHQSR